MKRLRRVQEEPCTERYKRGTKFSGPKSRRPDRRPRPESNWSNEAKKLIPGKIRFCTDQTDQYTSRLRSICVFLSTRDITRNSSTLIEQIELRGWVMYTQNRRRKLTIFFSPSTFLHVCSPFAGCSTSNREKCVTWERFSPCSVFVSAALSSDVEQHRRRAQLHHHLPHAHQSGVALFPKGMIQRQTTMKKCSKALIESLVTRECSGLQCSNWRTISSDLGCTVWKQNKQH